LREVVSSVFGHIALVVTSQDKNSAVPTKTF
jgi:hypothetical protein